MAIRVSRHSNVSKQATLMDGLDVSPLKWRVCGCGLNRFVHEGMNHISNVKVHLKTRDWKCKYLRVHCKQEVTSLVCHSYITMHFSYLLVGQVVAIREHMTA